MSSFRSAAAVYREIEKSQGLFKYNKTRLTLRDPKLKPFSSMSDSEVNQFLSSMIERVGLYVRRIISPGTEGSRSSKFPTFVSTEPQGSREFMIVFGYAHSVAEEIQVTELKRALQRIIDRDGSASVWNGRSFVSVNGIMRKGGSREKADAVMHFDGDQRIAISLKNLANGRASEMQGWSGVIGIRGEGPVIDFADAFCASGASRTWRRLNDDSLKRGACWGIGACKVDVIVAGSGLDLVPDGEGYRIGAKTLGGIWYECDETIPDGDFEPVLFCRPSGEHSIMTSAGAVQGTRMMIAPIAHARASSRSIEI